MFVCAWSKMWACVQRSASPIGKIFVFIARDEAKEAKMNVKSWLPRFILSNHRLVHTLGQESGGVLGQRINHEKGRALRSKKGHTRPHDRLFANSISLIISAIINVYNARTLIRCKLVSNVRGIKSHFPSAIDWLGSRRYPIVPHND